MTKTLGIVRTIADLRARTRQWRDHGETSALVPTMGALHDGHLSLVDIGRTAADRVVATIFVNPKQFAPSEDFDSYPRGEHADLALLTDRQADLVFIPPAAEMYPDNFSTSVAVAGLTEQLCGASRPHFFGGVATVVAKLLIQAQTDFAIFGEKDYQQLLVIRRMARDLDIPTQILGAPIIREADGLAMSSRNEYLTPDQRKLAGRFNLILSETADAVACGAEIEVALSQGLKELNSAGFDQTDYLDIRDDTTLAAMSGTLDCPARIFGAVILGETRLIDNMIVTPNAPS